MQKSMEITLLAWGYCRLVRDLPTSILGGCRTQGPWWLIRGTCTLSMGLQSGRVTPVCLPPRRTTRRPLCVRVDVVLYRSVTRCFLLRSVGSVVFLLPNIWFVCTHDLAWVWFLIWFSAFFLQATGCKRKFVGSVVAQHLICLYSYLAWAWFLIWFSASFLQATGCKRKFVGSVVAQHLICLYSYLAWAWFLIWFSAFFFRQQDAKGSLLVLLFFCPTFDLSVLLSGMSVIPDLVFGVFLQATGCKKRFEIPATEVDNCVEFRRRALAIKPKQTQAE